MNSNFEPNSQIKPSWRDRGGSINPLNPLRLFLNIASISGFVTSSVSSNLPSKNLKLVMFWLHFPETQVNCGISQSFKVGVVQSFNCLPSMSKNLTCSNFGRLARTSWTWSESLQSCGKKTATRFGECWSNLQIGRPRTACGGLIMYLRTTDELRMNLWLLNIQNLWYVTGLIGEWLMASVLVCIRTRNAVLCHRLETHSTASNWVSAKWRRTCSNSSSMSPSVTVYWNSYCWTENLTLT